MKKIFIFILLFVSFQCFGQNKKEILTNVEIVKLSKLELSPSAIIAKIKNSSTHFDVSVDALVSLKQDGVNGDVISEMISSSTVEQREIANQKDYRDPKTMRKEGIYYYNKSDTSNLFITIDPTVVSGSKSGGVGTAIAQQYTYGIAKSKQTSEIAGAHSRKQIPHVRAKFYFYLAGNLSPNEFALVKLIERKRTRQMIVGSFNAFGGMSGIEAKQKVDFGYDQVAEGIYKVYSKEPFEDGEYCFVYTGATPSIFSNNNIYDFGINAESGR